MPRELEVEVTAVNQLNVAGMETAYGWGDGATRQAVRGQVREIMIRKDGQSQFALHISDDGGIILTDYAGLCFQQQMPGQLRLTPFRGWRD